MNRDLRARDGADAAIDAEIGNMELAFRMQSDAPDVMSLANEPQSVREMYGIGEPVTDDFGRACLMARRFAERGVRYITVMHSTRAFGNLWDQHRDLYDGHSKNAEAVDVPIAALLKDLKSRGMLDDTLVMCGSEFGRTPVFEFQDGNEGRLRNGRDHNPHGFTMWFAGGGVKSGILLRRDRRLRLLRHREQGHGPRPARDDPAPDGPRPRTPHLPPRRPGLPVDGRLRERGPRHPRLMVHREGGDHEEF